jgi:hypothetical protein
MHIALLWSVTIYSFVDTYMKRILNGKVIFGHTWACFFSETTQHMKAVVFWNVMSRILAHDY